MVEPELTPPPFIDITVYTEGDVQRACREARELAMRCGFSVESAYEIDISTSELGRNLLAHAHRGGRISIAVVEGRLPSDPRVSCNGIELVAEDDGPGIGDLELAMRDGYSTKKTLGLGLPSVRRLMSEFHIASELGRGTRVTARKWLAPCK